VIVAEDGVLLREGLVRILQDDGYHVLQAVGNGSELVAATRLLRPDLVVTDVRMPPGGTDEGIVAGRIIRTEYPGTALVLLSQYVEATRAVDLFQQDPAGLGYLLKDRVLQISEFLASVRRVALGGSAVDPEIVSQLLNTPAGVPGTLGMLSDRERTALELMAQGLSNAGIAQQMFVGVRTVETYIASVFRKLDVHDSPEDHRRVRAVLVYLAGLEG
jgi:serine/threonine-protein kinase